jgi:hypothetical protein
MDITVKSSTDSTYTLPGPYDMSGVKPSYGIGSTPERHITEESVPVLGTFLNHAVLSCDNNLSSLIETGKVLPGYGKYPISGLQASSIVSSELEVKAPQSPKYHPDIEGLMKKQSALSIHTRDTLASRMGSK